MSEEKKAVTLYCSFCGKSQHKVTRLIQGKTGNICDECVELCLDTLCENPNAGLSERVRRFGQIKQLEESVEKLQAAAGRLLAREDERREPFDTMRSALGELEGALKDD
ncbi:MAG: hypothetical protein ISR99_03060 [Parcubacteria group bacterium]|nr:hypothetical protein [Parcubacteria group bacterium]